VVRRETFVIYRPTCASWPLQATVISPDLIQEEIVVDYIFTYVLLN
jgi:hypothetical protein